MLFLTVFITGCGEEKTGEETAVSLAAALHKKENLPNVTVTVQDGVATLAGWVKEPQMASEAEAIASEAEDVHEVVNHLVIGVNPAEQEQLSTEVRKVLQDYNTVSAIISDSVVMLNGSIKKEDLPALVQKIEALKVKEVITARVAVE